MSREQRLFDRPPYRVLYVGAVGGHGLGKSTMMRNLSERLTAELPDIYHVVRRSMAGPLREKLNQIAPYHISSEKRHPLERPTLQWTGEAYRAQDNNYWIREYLNPAGLDYGRLNIVLTDDVYHVNEAMLTDVLLLIGQPPAELGEGYEPESIRQTRMLLRYAEQLHPGDTVRLDPISPEELSTTETQDRVVSAIQAAIHRRSRQGGDFR